MDFKTSKVKIFDIDIDNLSMGETIDIISESVNTKQPIMQIVVNAGKLVNMQHDQELFDSVKNADLVNVDGMAVVWASKWLGKPLKERVSGVDLFVKLVERASKRNESIYLLGASEDVVSTVALKFEGLYGKGIVGGYRNGYFSSEEELAIVTDIVASNATYLFVAISSPKKEVFLSKYKDQLSSVGFTMGVGGSFDVVSGKVKRAPLWVQNCGMEWFYRFLQEPKRMWKRSFITNGKFVFLVIKEKFKQ